jgi:hypothetical protein
MAERVVLVTGSLAEPRVQRVADQVASDALEPIVANVGVKVAALMTTEIVERRLTLPEGADRVVMPGRFRGDLDRCRIALERASSAGRTRWRICRNTSVTRKRRSISRSTT